jgi:hypothetical protein
MNRDAESIVEAVKADIALQLSWSLYSLTFCSAGSGFGSK